MTYSREKLISLRSLINKAAEHLSDEEALSGIELYPVWKYPEHYEKDQRVREGNKLYRVIQSHDSQADWQPSQTPALFAEVGLPGEITVWKQPLGAEDAYRLGAKVYYPDKGDPVYENDLDYNVYPPDVAGWHIVI